MSLPKPTHNSAIAYIIQQALADDNKDIIDEVGEINPPYPTKFSTIEVSDYNGYLYKITIEQI
tara:strand:+ start:1072 stop:1260 length:189 start_codon:yes stop_codon:yes gene_type:complete